MRPILIALTCCAASPMAVAQIVPVAQTRAVEADVFLSGPGGSTSDSDSDSAIDLSPYVSSVGADLSDALANATARGQQDSSISASRIDVDNEASIGLGSFDGSWIAGGTARSDAEFQFTLTEKVRFQLSGAVENSRRSEARFRLTRNGSPLFDIVASDPIGEFIAVDESGLLEPGAYVFIATTWADNSVVLESTGAFADTRLVLDVFTLVETYCSAAPNSTGSGATMSSNGSTSVTANDLELVAQGTPPGSSGLFYYGANRIQAPFGDGFRCVGGGSFRLQPPVQSDATGTASYAIDNTTGPPSSGTGQFTSTSSWNFQLWYRDPMGPGGNGFNLSDGLSAVFCP